MTLRHIQCPATCELCSHWIPNHSSDCPRSGVHPSQWSINTNEIEIMYTSEEPDLAIEQENYIDFEED
ncbi:hypothetical protein BD560DRAFT_395434 [Blakeslea trispora]|nr:hypothetical protein BD560DRAFT_395434 [Blakeslea trispora]